MCSSKKAMKQWQRLVYQRLVTIQGVLLKKKKRLNLSRNSELCCVLSCSIPLSPLSLPIPIVALKTSSCGITVVMKTSSLEVTGRDKMV